MSTNENTNKLNNQLPNAGMPNPDDFRPTSITANEAIDMPLLHIDHDYKTTEFGRMLLINCIRRDTHEEITIRNGSVHILNYFDAVNESGNEKRKFGFTFRKWGKKSFSIELNQVTEDEIMTILGTETDDALAQLKMAGFDVSAEEFTRGQAGTVEQ